MKKDLSLALLLGGIIGGIMTFSLYKITNLAIRKVKNNNSPTQTQTPKATNVQETNKIETPTSILTNTATTQITGESKANNHLVITSNTKDYPLTTSPDGQFKQTVTLEPGMNTFLVSLLVSDQPMTKYVYIFYSPKITIESNNYTIKMGNVIDISDTSFQISTYATKNGSASELLLLTTDDNSVFEKLKNNELVSATKSELAIGDFVVVVDSYVFIIPKPADSLLNPEKTTVTKTMLTNKKLVVYPADYKPKLDDQIWLTANKTIIATTP